MKVQRTRKHSDVPSIHAAAKRPEDIVLSESRSMRNSGVIRFQVHGLPIAQGSHRSWLVNGKPVITSTAKGLGSWRRLVADVAHDSHRRNLGKGPWGSYSTLGFPSRNPRRRRGAFGPTKGRTSTNSAVQF